MGGLPSAVPSVEAMFAAKVVAHQARGHNHFHSGSALDSSRPAVVPTLRAHTW